MAPVSLAGPLLEPLFGDPEAAAILSDAAFVDRMVSVEAALALACADAGLIPAAAARDIAAHLAAARPDMAVLAAGTASAGVAVPALVEMLRQGLPEQTGAWLHWGATSQDIVDCAHVLQWSAMLDLLEARLNRLLDLMQAASLAHADTPMAARTRSQIATPITFGLRIAQWAQPLIGLSQDLPQLRRRLLRVQFGGASGSGSAVDPSTAGGGLPDHVREPHRASEPLPGPRQHGL